MEKIILKHKKKNRFSRTKTTTFEIFTEASEIVYHRYYLSNKLSMFNAYIAKDSNDLKQKLKTISVFINSDNKERALHEINAIESGINTMDAEAMVGLASFFPFVKSINGIDLDIKLTSDKCLELAKEYSDMITMSTVKKKDKIQEKIAREIELRCKLKSNSFNSSQLQSYLIQLAIDIQKGIFEKSEQREIDIMLRNEILNIDPNSSDFFDFKHDRELHNNSVIISKFTQMDVSKMNIIQYIDALNLIQEYNKAQKDLLTK